MLRHVIVVLLAIAIVGCTRQEAPAPSMAAGAPAQAGSADPNGYLAYAHTIAIRADDDKVAGLFDAAQAACRAAAEESCVILEASVHRGEGASASLRFRAKSEGIRKLVGVLSAGGEVTNHSTSAEDLAGPIADTEKQLAMLTDYRTRLEALRNRPSNDLEALMKLTRVLAEVQSQIETLSGSQAHLMKRVQTELLTVSINAWHDESFWSPIADSGRSFSGILSHAIAGLILAVAYLLPWALVLGLITWMVRVILERRRRKRVDSALG
jgi:hypothetical protein